MSISNLGDCRFEVLTRGEEFLGLGKIWIGETLVRSGRLPLRPATQAFSGWELSALRLREVRESEGETRIRCQAEFRPLETKMMRDHSFDPIHEIGDWDAAPTESGDFDLVLRPAGDDFNGVHFGGFSYHYEFDCPTTQLFYVIDKASWELGGDIRGATAYSQSACSSPAVTFEADTVWSTEGVIFFDEEATRQNPVMTHNLPRWASHGSFDFQFKGDATLIGVFERVELIRSVVAREAGEAELKTFDKHIFDQTAAYSTVPKKILLSTEPKSTTAQQNLWTWIHCEVEERARQEFGLQEEPFYPRVAWNFWENFTVDSYYRDLIPATENIGCREVFVDNLKKSAMSEDAPMKGQFHWNMCCPHEFEIADSLGGEAGVKKLVDDCEAQDIRVMSWTNNMQGVSSPLANSDRSQERAAWFVKLEDARQQYGGAYSIGMSAMDMTVDAAREYFVQSHLEIKAKTGLSGYLFDSFYNLGWMPVSYQNMMPRTMWRGLLQAFKELQDGGVHMLIESFGPFGMPQHGHPSSYNFDTLFLCYRVGLGNDYSTVPTQSPLYQGHPDDARNTYILLAHMAGCDLALWKDGKRIDERWTDAHKQALRDYHDTMDEMHVRYLQEDGAGVLWHNADKTRATLWNFTAREVALPGCVCDSTAGRPLVPADSYQLEPCHTYIITGAELPTMIVSGTG